MATHGTFSVIGYVLVKNVLEHNFGGNNSTQVILVLFSSPTGARDIRRWQLSQRFALCVFENLRLVEPCLDCICL